MAPSEYRTKLETLVRKYRKNDVGAKYILNWDIFWEEKSHFVKLIDEGTIKSSLDIGTGIGMLPYLLQQKGIYVEGTEISEQMNDGLYTECCDLIGLKRHVVEILPNQPMNLTRKYDLILASRTIFDRQKGFDWSFFIDDCFKHCNTVLFKMNHVGRASVYPSKVRPFLFKNPQEHKVIRKSWFIKINKSEWVL